jgi:membrane-associated phospholipid phosphatase
VKPRVVTLLLCSALIVPATAARADVITEWNAAALDAIRAEKTPPPPASRALAILHVSIYDAIDGIVRSGEPYFVRSSVPASASVEAAASTAAHLALVRLFPGESPRLDDRLASDLAAISDGPAKRAGIEWGEHVASQILALRAIDNADAVIAAPSGIGPGAWQPTPPAFAAYLLPQWAFVTPFALPNGSFVRPPGPPALDSARWTADYDDVKALGSAVGSSRTPEQTQIALFWADGAGTETPPGHWNRIAQVVSAARGMTLVDKARLFALLNIAMADAAISAWDAKLAYDFWRPVTAIRNGDSDGNPDTAADPTWSPFLVTPPFPDYVSGHSTFSGAAATVLAMFFGTDRASFTVGSDGLPAVTRSFSSFIAAAREAAISRVYGGIHFRSASDDGLATGIAIGEWTVRHFLQVKDSRSRR